MSKLNEELLIRYLENRCSDEDFAKINTWMKESEENARELFRMEQVYHLGKFPFDSAAELTAKAERKLDKRLADEQQQQVRKTFQMRTLMRYVASIALIVVLAGGFFVLRPQAEEEMLTAMAAPGEVRELVLPDGTKVWLNHSAKLTYPRAFSKQERNVMLEGEAYFEVARNREKPFTVKSSAMDVRVLGTSFNVRCMPDNSFAETTLVEGEVEVKSNKGFIMLEPGQKAVLNRVTGRMLVKQVDARMEVVWHNDLIPFEKVTIFRIAAVLERFYGVKIILSPDVDSNKTYSGVLKRKDSIESVLQSLTHSIPFKFRKVDDNIFISSEGTKQK